MVNWFKYQNGHIEVCGFKPEAKEGYFSGLDNGEKECYLCRFWVVLGTSFYLIFYSVCRFW